MSEPIHEDGHPPAAGPHPAAGGSGLTRKWHGVPIWAWTLGGTVAAVVAVKWFRGRHNGKGTGTSSTGTGTNTVQNCYDISGALVPCAAAAANNAAGGAGQLGGTLGSLLTGTTGTTSATTTPGTTKTTTGTGTGTGTGDGDGDGGGSTVPAPTTSTGTTTGKQPITAVPGNLRVAKLFTNSVELTWSRPSIPSGQGPLTGYGALAWEEPSGRKVGSGSINLPVGHEFLNIGSLKSKTRYTAWVWCEPINSGGPHATVSWTTT